MTGKWKAVGSATILEVFYDGRYKSTINGVVVETGKMTNGAWSIQADSGRVDNGSFTLNGGDLQYISFIVRRNSQAPKPGYINAPFIVSVSRWLTPQERTTPNQVDRTCSVMVEIIVFASPSSIKNRAC